MDNVFKRFLKKNVKDKKHLTWGAKYKLTFVNHVR